MVNRVIKQPLLEGSSSLPSILKINKGSHYLVNTINGDAINSGRVYKASALSGAIGDNYNEFTIDFFADSPDTMTDGVKRLYLSVINDIFVTIKKDIELERYFKIFKIDDLSYQAMTMNNYDFFIKVFKVVETTEFNKSDENVSGIYEECTGTSENKYTVANYEKISTNSIAIIKAYTTKEAWILVDKDVINTNDTFKLIIDFTYKFFKDETSNKLRFPNINTYSNVQDLFNITELSSPYYDRYLFSHNNQNMAFLNKQSEYITQSVTEIFSLSNTAMNFTLKTIPQVNVRALRNNNETLDLSKFKQKTLFTMDEVRPYLLSLSYEVYGYHKRNTALGVRCFNTPNDDEFERFEVYPVLPGMTHYLFKINSVGDISKPVRVIDITENKIRKLLKEKHIYLYNYNDLKFNTFIENDQLYLDIYSYIPYEYEAANPVFVDINNSDVTVFTLDDIDFIDDHSADYRSRFDISRTYEDTYSYPYDLTENEYYLPYFGNDKFVKTIILDNYELQENSHLVIPQVFSSDIDLLDLKDGIIANKYFDILSWDGGDRPISEQDQRTLFEKLKVDNLIDSSDIEQQFTDIGFRGGYTSNFSAAQLLTNYENDQLVLCENLADLLPPSFVTRKVNKNEDIDMRDCFFAYVETPSGDYSKFLNLTFKYVYEENGVTKNIEVFQPYKSYDSRGGKFIIPADQDHLLSISCDKDNCKVYMMQ